MPYKANEVPSGTKDVPAHGQAIYRAAFNSANSAGKSEEVAHAIAWAAVKKKYKKKGDKWVSKDGAAVIDALSVSVPAMIRLMEYGREKAKTDLDLHKVVEKVTKIHEQKGSVESADLEGVADGDHIMTTDREFSAEQRKKAAKSGAAMKGGGYPIENEADLKNAIRAIGRAKDPAATKAHIKTRARALGLTKLIPENWDAEPEELEDKKKIPPDEEDDNDEDDMEDAMSTVQLTDSFVIDGVRKLKDGSLVANARIARTGIQNYHGEEIGMPGTSVVRVYRPPEEVFDKKSMRSLAGIPITLFHPSTMVDTSNWKEHAIGETGDEVARDGEFVRVPMMIRDAAAIKAYEKDGIKELSVGYSTELKWGKGTTPSGEVYDAKQTAIRGNHLAVVPAARGGSLLRIGDDRKESHMAKILVGDRLIEFGDEVEAQHVQAYIAQLKDAKKKDDDNDADDVEEERKKVTNEKDAALKDAAALRGEVAALKKQLEDAATKLTGKALDEIVKERTQLLLKADSIMEGKVDFNGKEPAEIRRTVVTAKLGDAAKDLKDDEIIGAFKALTVNVKPRTGTDRLADNLTLLGQGGGNDANDPKAIKDAAYGEYVKNLTGGWRPRSST